MLKQQAQKQRESREGGRKGERDVDKGKKTKIKREGRTGTQRAWKREEEDERETEKGLTSDERGGEISIENRG